MKVGSTIPWCWVLDCVRAEAVLAEHWVCTCALLSRLPPLCLSSGESCELGLAPQSCLHGNRNESETHRQLVHSGRQAQQRPGEQGLTLAIHAFAVLPSDLQPINCTVLVESGYRERLRFGDTRSYYLHLWTLELKQAVTSVGRPCPRGFYTLVDMTERN